MAKNCIRCKREISEAQKNCLVCGASQSYFFHYYKTVVVFLLLLSGTVAAGYWFENHPEKLAELNRLKTIANEANKSQLKVAQLETLIDQNNRKLESAQQKLALMEENASVENESDSQRNSEFEKTKARAAKEQKRASWLSKENTRLKTENTSLNEQLLALQAKPNNIDQSSSPMVNIPIPAPVNPNQSIDSAKKEPQ